MNPSYYSRETSTNNRLTQNAALFSPGKNMDKGNSVISQTSRNMSMMNIKKSQGRFLNPLGANGGGNESGFAAQSPGINQGGHGMISHPKMPTSLIDKYPNGNKQQ